MGHLIFNLTLICHELFIGVRNLGMTMLRASYTPKICCKIRKGVAASLFPSFSSFEFIYLFIYAYVSVYVCLCLRVCLCMCACVCLCLCISVLCMHLAHRAAEATATPDLCYDPW